MSTIPESTHAVAAPCNQGPSLGTTPAARILIADDHDTTRLYLGVLLKQAHYRVESVSDGLLAWNLLTDHANGSSTQSGTWNTSFDLLLVDWSMPGLSGLDLVRRIRGHSGIRSTFIVLVTANDKVESRVEGLEAGADDYIIKPFHPAELLARVRAGLRMRALQRELGQLQHQLAAAHLAAAAGHEINNPLMALLGNWELLGRRLAQKEPDPEISKRMEAIGSAAERIRKITASLRHLKHVRLMPYMGESQMLDLAGAPGGPEHGKVIGNESIQ